MGIWRWRVGPLGWGPGGDKDEALVQNKVQSKDKSLHA